MDYEDKIRELLTAEGVSKDVIDKVIDIVDDRSWERYYDGMHSQRVIDYEYPHG